MMLNDLKRVTEIDHKINRLHRELSNLYQLRVQYFEHKPGITSNSQLQLQTTTANLGSNESSSETEYQKLAAIWGKYNVEIPKLAEMKKVLNRAAEVKKELASAQPELENKLTTVLVPPAKYIGPPKHNTMRLNQTFCSSSDHFSSNVVNTSKGRKWRVMVVYSPAEGINFGSAQSILANKQHIIGEHDAGKLGIVEYIAFTLQQDAPSDQGTWAILLGDRQRNADGLVPSATFMDGQYRFEMDVPEGWFGDERFRPAVLAGSV